MKMRLIEKALICMVIALFFGAGVTSGMITYEFSNESPFQMYTLSNTQYACFTYFPSNPVAGETVKFDASCSVGDITDYSWHYIIEGGGWPVSMGTGKIIYYSWSEPGNYIVTLQVTFSNSDTDSVTHTITVVDTNLDPWISLISPNGGESYNGDVLITWSYNYPFDCLPCFDISCQKQGGSWTRVLSNIKGKGSGEMTMSVVWETSNRYGYYKIRVDMNHCGGEVVASDTSNGWFFIGSNDSPVACYDCSTVNPSIGETVDFDGSCSSDPDGYIDEYFWSYTIDGGVPVDMGSGKTVSYSWSNSGTYQVTLEVTDNNGATDQETKAITVGGSNDDLDCSGSLVWTSVEPGSNVRGSFTIRNIGDTGSGLHWRIESYPNWGNWRFTPESGTGLKPSDGPVTIQVSVDAPNVEEASFSGQVLVVNVNDGSDYETLPVSLSTPVNKVITYPLLNYLNNLLQHHLGISPFLRYIMSL